MLNLKQFIYKQEVIGNFSLQNKEVIHVAFGIDKNYAAPFGIMLTSIIKNNSDVNIMCHLFVSSIDDNDLMRLHNLVTNNMSLKIDIRYVNETVFQGFHTEGNYTLAVYFRILVADVLYNEIDKIIYIDADTLCIGSLRLLWNMSFNNNIFMAVLDKGDWLPEHKKKLGITKKEYFNTGLLYIDLKKWYQSKLSEKMISLLSQRSFPLVDQDALNVLVNDGVKLLPDRFNYFCLLENHELSVPEDTVIIHFAGRLKPWQPWCSSPQRYIYMEYYRNSYWKDFLYKPLNYQENRLMARWLRKQGLWRQAFQWYWRYFRARQIIKQKTN